MNVQEGIVARCDAQGYNLLTCPFDPDARGIARLALQFVEKTHVDGLVIAPPLADRKTLAREVSLEVTRYLLGPGHRQIAFIQDHPAHAGSRDRLQGYLAAMREADIEPKVRLIQQGLFSLESGFESGQRMLTARAAPTAIFASNDYMAAGVVMRESTGSARGI